LDFIFNVNCSPVNSGVRFLLVEGKMLALDSPRWGELTHAYGGASDVPELLRNLKTAPPPTDYRSEPWFTLWSALCHQNDVYTASYAAIPHIVALAADKQRAARLEHVHFIASVEAFRHRENAPPMPADLESGYAASIARAASLVLDCLESDWDESEYKVLLGALAVMRGQYKLGAAIFELEEEIECSACESILSTRGYDLFDEI
jgi:hypothetical protein